MMHTADMLKVFAEHRGDAIVISGRGGKHWMGISDTIFDLPLGDPAMGGHSGFGLGLALAQPNRRVVLFDSEGDIRYFFGHFAEAEQHAKEMVDVQAGKVAPTDRRFGASHLLWARALAGQQRYQEALPHAEIADRLLAQNAVSTGAKQMGAQAHEVLVDVRSKLADK